MLLRCLLLVFLCIPTWGIAQLSIQFPLARFVTQRGTDNQGRLFIAARFPEAADRVEAQLTPFAAGQGIATGWQALLQTNVPDGLITGSVTGAGGWYVLTVRAVRGGVTVAQSVVQPVGIGEVFIVAGQSNARGIAANDNDLGALTGRVNSIDTINHFYPPNVPALFSSGDPMPFAPYTPLLAGKRIFPMGSSSWGWGELGDYLVRRLNVPVLFYNAGWDAATVDNWSNTAKGVPGCNLFYCVMNWPNLQPYTNLKNLMGYYGSSGGFRAILWHQGESESIRPSTIPLYAARLDSLIKRTRQDFDNRPIPWVVARVTFSGQTTSSAVLSQQQMVINSPGLGVFEGPLNDTIQNRNAGNVDVHFANAALPGPHPAYYLNPQQIPASMGLSRFARNWNNSLTDAFFQGATPMLPRVFVQTGSLTPLRGIGPLVPGDSLLVSFVTSGTFNATNQWTVEVLDEQGRFVSRIGQGGASPLRLRWPDSVGPGRYRARVVAGSPVTSGAPTPIFTVAYRPDIALSSAAGKRTLRENDTTTIYLTLRNDGIGRATDVRWRSRLPANMVATGISPTVAVANGVVSGTLASLEPGQSVSQAFSVRLLTAGVFWLTAEISHTTPLDVDSQPDSGTGDGQDDATQLDFRVGTGGSTYSSPNPSQVPLPAVQGNQPAPVADKADLSLQMQVSTRIPKLNELVTYTLVVNNIGGSTASNINTTTYLPAGMEFVDSSLMAPGGGGITGTTMTLLPRASATLTFRAKATTSGFKRIQAQVRYATPADPDSVPGNGFPTSQGEDDEAVVDIRVQ